MRKAVDAGAKVQVLFVTDGAQANLGVGMEESVKLRRKEAQSACQLVPCEMKELGISNAAPEPSVTDIAALRNAIDEFKPDFVFVPWLLDVPIKHRMVNHMLWLCDKQSPLKCEIWGYQVHNNLFPNVYVDITQQIDVKQKMLECFRSQNENFKRYDKIAIGLSAWNSRFAENKTVEYVETFMALPKEAYLNLVGNFYFDRFEQVYRNNDSLCSAMKRLHAEITA